MKPLSLLLVILLVFPCTLFAQEPGIDSIRIWPTNATKNDTVYAAVYVAATTPSKRVSISHIINGDTVNITGCYAIKSMSATMNFFADTVLLGKFSDGKYYLKFRAYRNLDTNACISIIDSNTALNSFIIHAPENINGTIRQFVSIYPNPTSGDVTISLPNGVEVEEVAVQDMAGRIVKTATDSRFSIAELPAGLYILQVHTNKGRFVQKLRKE